MTGNEEVIAVAIPLRLGLIGTGLWARQAHAPALRANPEVEFVGVWGRNMDNALAIAEPAGVSAFSTIDELLEAVDGVAIAVPPAVQAPIAVHAARAGKHLMLEKPIAVTRALADEIAATVAASGVSSVVCFTGLWIPRYAEWLSSLAEQSGWECGRIEMISSAMVTESGFENSAWRRQLGALWDLGPHAVAMVHAVLGTVESVTAIAGLRDQVHIAVRHTSGASSTVSVSLTAPSAVPGRQSYTFYGQHGRTSAPPLDPEIDHRARAYGCAVAALVAQARGVAAGDAPGIQLGAHVVAVLESAERAIKTGALQSVD
jgi:predicted dehydrogenase